MVTKKKDFQCKQCGSCCQLIFGLFEVARKGDLMRIYKHVQQHNNGFLWEKIQIRTFSEFLYYMRDFQAAKEILGIENPSCPFLSWDDNIATCSIHSIRPTGCRTFPESLEQAYQLTLDCKGWD